MPNKKKFKRNKYLQSTPLLMLMKSSIKILKSLTGIKVNVTKANADELIQRMKNEGR